MHVFRVCTYRQSLHFLLTYIIIIIIIIDNPGNPLKQIIEKAELVNSKYISYNKKLVNLHKTPTNCQKTLTVAFCNRSQSKIRTKAIADTDPKLGAYLKVIPALKGMEYQLLYEPGRVTISPRRNQGCFRKKLILKCRKANQIALFYKHMFLIGSVNYLAYLR